MSWLTQSSCSLAHPSSVHTLLKPQVLKNQALLKQQVLKNQQGLCHLLAFAAAAATIVLSNLHMLCNLHVKSMSAGSKVELQHQWAIVQTCKCNPHRSTWTILPMAGVCSSC